MPFPFACFLGDDRQFILVSSLFLINRETVTGALFIGTYVFASNFEKYYLKGWFEMPTFCDCVI